MVRRAEISGCRIEAFLGGHAKKEGKRKALKLLCGKWVVMYAVCGKGERRLWTWQKQTFGGSLGGDTGGGDLKL